MATEVVSIVDPDNGAGTDYTSLSAWEAGEQGDLTGARDEIATASCRSTSGGADTTALTLSGWTTSSTQYINIVVDSSCRHAGTWDTSAYRLTVGHSDAININEEFVRIDGLQVSMALTYASSRLAIRIASLSGSGNIHISNCILREVSNAYSYGGIGALYITGSQSIVIRIWNCLIYDFSSSSAYGGVYAYDDDYTTYAYNCTFVNCRYGIRNVSSALHAYNCGASGCTTAFSSLTTQTTCSSTTPTFVDAAADDFHLDSGDTTWLGQGTSDPGSGLFSDDIDGDTRPTSWSIGADDYASSGTTYTQTADLDALLKKTGLSAGLTLDALLRAAAAGQVSLDSLIYLARTGELSLDALLQITAGQSVSIDALVRAVESGAVSIDAFLQIALSASTGLDAILSGAQGGQVLLDALLQAAGVTSATGLDAILASLDAAQVSLDALISAARSGQLSFDALLQITAGQPVSIDALLYATATGALSLDALLSVLRGAAAQLDALLLLGASAGVQMDAILGALTITARESLRVPARAKTISAPERVTSIRVPARAKSITAT